MRIILSALLFVLPFSANAQDLKIVTDIAPIESLVLQVAGTDAQVTALVSNGASPHGFQFSYDQAEAVQSADIVIWVGPQLTPWLGEALGTLAPETSSLALLETASWPALELRNFATYFPEDEDDHDDLENDDHDDGHVGDVDPHAWTDPQVAIAWVGDIAIALSQADPENSDNYAANAATTIANLTALDGEIAAQLAGLSQRKLVVPHDAYQYFGHRYGLPASGAISLSDATPPGPDRIAALQDLIREYGIACVLSDPQSRSEWVELVREGTDAKTAIADTLGTAYAQGPDHYAATLQGLADAYAACLVD